MLPYTNRTEAKLRQLSQYFTGIPCKNGHLTYRYTSSGACSGCIRAHNQPVYDQAAIDRKAAKAQLVQVRLRCFVSDRGVLTTSAWALVVMRFPVLQLGDVDAHLLPQDKTGGTGLYAFNCHEDDVSQLRAIADGMLKAHRVDVVAVRRVAFGSAADAPVAPVPDWARVPRPGDPDYK